MGTKSPIEAVKRFCTSRTTSLALILTTLLTMLVGSFVPQAFLLSPAGRAKWHADHPVAASIAETLGLDQIYTHPLFVLVLAVAIVSLLFSCIDQFRLARRRGNEEGTVGGEAREAFSSRSLEECIRLVKQIGFRPAGRLQRYLRNPWGIWGSFLLHTGMLVVIVASLLIALTQERGLLHIAVGESFTPGQPWASTETGLLAKQLVLDQPVRLDEVRYEYWPTNGVKHVSSTISFLGSGGHTTTRKPEINSIIRHEGLRIYQGSDFGHAFFVEVTDGLGGKTAMLQLLINHQTTPDEPSYNEYGDLLGPGTVLLAKYLVDGEKRSLLRENPQLTLRLDAEGQEVGRLPLKPGGEGMIGPYRFKLLKFSRWTSLIFVKLAGIAGIFAGFGIIAVGGLLNYFTPPREIVLQQLAEGTVQLTWRPGRFGSFYEDEFDRIACALAGDKADG